VGLAALAGVKIQTGNLIGNGERIVSGLVQSFGALDFVSDNAGCFGKRPLPCNGLFVKLGAHKIYVVVDVSCVHPRHVVEGGEPPLSAARGARITRSPDHAEVMMTVPNAGASKDPAPDPEVTPKAPRKSRGPPLERPENVLHQAIDSLESPIAPAVDPARAQPELEETRQKILEGAKKIAVAQQSLNMTLHEYAKANKVDVVKVKGRNLISEMNKEGDTRVEESKNILSVGCRSIVPRQRTSEQRMQLHPS